MIHGLVQSALVAASFLASANVAAAQGGGAVNQLQMARLPQPAQRAEFPLVGEESAFKFSFIEDVRAACSRAAPSICCLNRPRYMQLVAWPV